MANIKITELNAAGSLAATDVVPVVDVSADETKKITAANLFRTLPDGTAAAPALAFSSDQANGVYLAGTDTVGISTGGTQRVTVDGSGNVTISGDLTVSGATTTVESTTVTIDDKNIELGSVATPTDTTADGGGITLKGATDKEIKWVNSTNYWTFSTGIEVGGHLQIDDNKEIRVGTGQDLKIYHNATNSFIDNSNGNFNIRNLSNDQDITLQTDDGSGGAAVYVRCDGSEGKVVLYHLGTEKLNTKSDGVNVTGEVQCDSLDVDGAADITGAVTLHGSLDLQDNDKILLGTGDDFEIYHDANDSFVLNKTGVLVVRNTVDDQDIVLQTDNGSGGNATYVRCDGSDGKVRLYFYGSEKLHTNSTGIDVIGEVQCDSLDVDGAADISGNLTVDSGTLHVDASNNRVGIGTSSASRKLHIVPSGSDAYDAVQVGDGLYIGNTSNNVNAAIFHQGGGADLEIGSQQHITFTTGGVAGSAAERIRITSSGDLCFGSTVGANNDGSGISIYNASFPRLSFRNSTTGNTTSDGSQLYLVNSDLYVTNNENANLIFRTNSTERLRLDAAGRLLLGTTTEGHANADNLTLADSGSCGLTLRSATNNFGRIYFSDGTSGDAEYRGIIQYDHTNNRMQFAANASTAMTIDSSGRVGIGTTQPAFSNGSGLEIARNGTAAIRIEDDSASKAVEVYVDSTGTTIDSRGTGARTNFAIAGNGKMLLDNSGRLMIGTTTEGAVAADDLTVATTGTTGITIRSGNTGNGNIYFSDATTGTGEYSGYLQYRHGDNALAFGTLSSERFRITSTGAWAIEGENNYGTSGQVLTSNGNDSPTWQTPSSAGGSNAITMNDSVKINFGASNDLQIFHDGSNSYLHDNGTGDLIARSSRFKVNNAANTESMIVATQDGSVSLNYNGTKKFETKSDGVDVTGEVQCDSLDVDGGADITGNVILHANLDFQDDDFILMGAGDDFKLHHNGSNSHIQNYTGGLYIDQNANDNDIQLRTDNGSGSITTYVLCDGSTGSTKLFHYGSEKLATQTYGIDVQGEVQCDSLDVDGSGDITGTLTLHGNLDMQDNDKILLGSGDDLEIYHDGGTSFIEDTGTGNLHLKTNGSEIKIEGASTSLARFYNGGAVELHHNGNKKLETTSNGVDITGFMQCDNPGVYLDGLDWTSSNKYMSSGNQFWQVGNNWNNSTGTFTCPVAGKYLVSADAQVHNVSTQSGASAQYANIIPRKNNSNYGQETVATSRADGSAGGATAKHGVVAFSIIMDCAVNDTIRVYSNHGFRTNAQNHLSIYFLG